MPQGGLPARVDAVRIGQVVRNLLSNAIKFTPRGGRIDVSLSKGSMPSGRRNTDFEAMPAAGCRFPTPGSGSRRRNWRASSTSSYRVPRPPQGGGGTGLGLSICSEIVAAPQRADSCPQQRCGRADFVVELPPRRRSRCDAAMVGRIDTMGSLVSYKHILVVDDEPFNREIILEILDDPGYCSVSPRTATRRGRGSAEPERPSTWCCSIA